MGLFGRRFTSMAAESEMETMLARVDFGLSNRDLLRGLAAAERTIGTLAEIIEASPFGIFWKDTDLRYLGSNTVFLDTAGCTNPLDLHGKSDLDLLPLEQVLVAEEADRLALASRAPVLDTSEVRQTADGRTLYLRGSRWPFFDEDGQILGVFGIFTDITEERRTAAEIQQKARQLAEYAALDELTGLPNRRSLNRALSLLLSERNRFALMFVDLDGFKVINDSLGHEVGDRVVRAVGERLVECVPRAALIARLGGDEFAIVLIDEHEQDAEAIGARLVEDFRRPILIDDLDLYCSASIGLARRADHHSEPAHVLRDADLAMYEAKSNGRDRCEVFSPEMFKDAEEGLYMRNRVARAVRGEEFQLYYQPIFRADNGRLSGVEALLRMPTEDRSGMEPASRFLPHLEQTGLILPVGEWIVERSLRQLAEWQRDYRVQANLGVNVNLSPLQLGSDGLSSMILDCLRAHQIRPERLTVEMTETAVADSSRIVRANLESLREAGVRIAMDDFGVGQSSLALLGDLPFDIVKIDKLFVQGIGSTRHEQLLLGVIRMLQTLDITTCAEGVENEDQRSWLIQQGCSFLQGYHLGRPVPPERL